MHLKEARGRRERPRVGAAALGPEWTEQALFLGQGHGRPGGCGHRSQAWGPGSWALLCRFLVVTTPSGPQFPMISGDLPVPHPEFSEFEEVRARAKSCSELLTVGSGQDGGSAGGGRTVGTACLCGRVNLMSVGKRRGWEGFEKGSDVATAVLGAV